MIPVLGAAEIRAADADAIAGGLPGIVLMDQASRAVAEVARDWWRGRTGPVIIACGPGNNGGDGYGCARWLWGWGVPVRLWHLAASSTGDAATFRALCERLGIQSVNGVDGAAVVVDAVLGTGLTRPVTGEIASALRAIHASDAPVIAVDVPSGLDADTGAILGVAVRAAVTVTFAAGKPGLYAEPGADLAGEVRVVDIGLPPRRGRAEIPELGDLPRWPKRRGADHKGRGGHLLVVAGSTRYAGAAALACRGALAAGAGLVTLACPRAALARLAASLGPEVMVHPADGDDQITALDPRWLDGVTAVVAGPGLGGGSPMPEPVAAGLRAWWRDLHLPVLFDADALPFAYGPGAGERVITPHPGEAARRLGLDTAAVSADRFAAAAMLAEDGAVALLKGRHTLIAEVGQPISINPTGSPVLATAGSGDVLAGVIGALLAQGLPGRDAAILGAWAHGRAGQRLADQRAVGWTAADFPAEIARVASERA